MEYTPYVFAVCCVMLLGFIIFLLSVKENKWAKEMEEESIKLGLEEENSGELNNSSSNKLSKAEFKSFLLILASVALWYIGYNSITSKYSVYATNILGFDFNFTLIIAQAAAIVSYLPVGMIAFLLQSFLYKAMGVEIPEAVSELHVADPYIVNGFCLVLFGSFIIAALLMGCSWRDYWKLLRDPEQIVNFSATYGNAVMLMNVGLYGMYILLYYNVIGAEFNGVTFGVIFCMLSTCNAGSHPGNIWPITLGYSMASQLFQHLAPLTGGDFSQYLHSQSIIVGLCYANGLSPIADRYGWFYGMVAAMLHFCMVTTVPQLHGGMCLYNGGFTAALVCMLMVPSLERHFRPKLERRAARKLNAANKVR